MTAGAPKAKASASASTGAIDLDGIKAAAASIREKLPDLQVLTKDDRQQLFKMGDKRAAVVQHALKAAENPLVQAVLPPSFNRAQFAASAARTAELVEVRTVLDHLRSHVDDPAMAVGSVTVNGAAKLYGYVQAGAKDNPGLKPIAEQLGEAFKKASAKPQLDSPDKK